MKDKIEFFYLEKTRKIYRKSKKDSAYYDRENGGWIPIFLGERQVKRLVSFKYFTKITKEEVALLI